MKLLYAFSYLLNNSFQEQSSKDLEIYKEIYKIDADGWLVDRSGQINFPIGEILDPEFSFPNSFSPIGFDQACIESAQKLLAEGKPIYILWSGGIDSTAMLCSFIASKQDLSLVKIILNNDSINEYKKFYETYIRGKFEILVTEEAMQRMSLGSLDGIVLSGEHGDQLFGSPLVNGIHQSFPKGFLKQPFNRENFKIFASSKGMSDISSDCWFDIYSESANSSPRPISSMFDFAWWHGFNFRWQAIGLKMLPRIKKEIDLRTFYSSKELQSWSVYHKPDLDRLETLKIEPKKFILSLTGDRDYFENKIKYPSSTLYYGKPAAAGVDQNKNKISLNNFKVSDYYNPNNSISHWLELNQKEVNR